MEDSLKKLLDAERRADALVNKAIGERDRLIDEALREVKTAEERFDARIPEIRDNFRQRAEERAAQVIAEVRRRYTERQEALEEDVARRRDKAIQAALAVMLDIDAG
ncbi:MAG: ATPase [Pseudomonadota bacterium]